MRSVSIAHNYAEALFELGVKSGQTAAYADLLEAVADGLAASPKAQTVLLSPRVPKAAKAKLLADAMAGSPREFILFLQAVVKRGRQGLFPEMASEFRGLLDVRLGQARATVTVARPADAALKQKIAERLTAVVGKQVIARFVEDPSLLGGMIVRVNDRVFDGSVRRKMTLLRRQLLAR